MNKHLTTGRIACYLVLLAAACTLVFGAAYSRFSSHVTGSGTANVASVALNSRMDVSKQLEGMMPGDTRTIGLKVSNREDDGAVSEVAQSYTITIETTGNLPLVYELSTGDSSKGDHALDKSDNLLVWTGGVLPHSTQTTHNYVLSVSWPETSNPASSKDEIDLVAVTVDAKQAVN